MSLFTSAATTVRALALLSAVALSNASAQVILDDTFADGTRTDQNLPTESAWFASTGPSLTAAPNAMTLALGGSAVLMITYFGPGSSTPIQIGIGDELRATLKLKFSGVAAQNANEGFRIALCDFADSTLSPKRVTADGMSSSSQGANVQAYALFQNMGATFNSSFPMDIRKRTTLADSALLSSSSDWTTLTFGPGDTNGFGGFSAGTNYTLQLSLVRTDTSSMAITVTWLNTATGGSLSTSVTDDSATGFNFDGIALRPQNAAASASGIIFNEVRVEVIPASTEPSITSEPADQTVFSTQPASFAALAGGTSPLSYQWYFNTNTLLDGATNASLTLPNAEPTNAGVYSVIVTNSYGSATSRLASLTVVIPDPPSITGQPQDQSVHSGENATFSVTADGTGPLAYQWYFNTNTALPNAKSASLTLTNVQASNAGVYSVLITNIAGSITSTGAVLSVNTNPQPPSFIQQPVSVFANVGDTVGFTSAATGAQPIGFQWLKDGGSLAGALSPSITVTNAQLTNGGSYVVVATNSAGAATSSIALLMVAPVTPPPNSAFNLAGFGATVTGGGVLPDNDPGYRKVYDAVDLATALGDKTGVIKVIEIMNDLNLGYNEVPADAKVNSEPFRADIAPLLHPVLITSGVTLLDVQDKNNLTIFSTNGVSLRHVHFNVKRCVNVIIRNLKFDELWEWDEDSEGNYDRNNWDFITIGDSGTCSNVWVDHCEFTKAYDGVIDIKNGSSGITLSWCKFSADDGGANSFVRQQINFLEQSPSSYPLYGLLRANGFRVEDVIAVARSQKKGHLIGANSFDAANANHTVTIHHNWYENMQDRMPRLRAGNVHLFNVYTHNSDARAADLMRDAKVSTNATLTANLGGSSPNYHFDVTLNGAISTESGAVLVEKSQFIDVASPVRNNQTDANNPAYTGKIRVLDMIYSLDGSHYRGGSEDPGSPLAPVPAPPIAFSWNLPGNQLPYSYSMDDPALLPAMLTGSSGAGSAKLFWAKTNWMKTSYAASGPVILAPPLDETVSAGQTALFGVVALGSGTLSYQWYFNTNTLIAGGTNALLAVPNAQASSVGMYSVVVTNSVGAATSSVAVLTVNLSGFEFWRSQNFTPQQLSDPAISGPGATPANDGVANLIKYALGLLPFQVDSPPLYSFRFENGDGVLTYHRPGSITDVTYNVQVSTDLANWTESGVTQQMTGTDGNGFQIWEAHFTGSASTARFFRLLFQGN